MMFNITRHEGNVRHIMIMHGWLLRVYRNKAEKGIPSWESVRVSLRGKITLASEHLKAAITNLIPWSNKKVETVVIRLILLSWLQFTFWAPNQLYKRPYKETTTRIAQKSINTRFINIMKNISSTSSYSLNEYYEKRFLSHPLFPERVLFKQQSSRESRKTRVGKEDRVVEMVKTHQIT